MSSFHGPLRVGIGGPVGSGKTALMDLLCKTMRERYDIAAITNGITRPVFLSQNHPSHSSFPLSQPQLKPKKSFVSVAVPEY